MTQAPLRRISLLLLAGFAFTLAASGGCSRMSEGERCDFTNAGDQDCDDGLECVPAQQLVTTSGSAADRCCPPVTRGSSDSRCQRSTGAPSAGGSSGAGGTSGTGGAAGESGAGMGGTPSGGEGGQPPGSMAGDGGMSSAGMGGI